MSPAHYLPEGLAKPRPDRNGLDAAYWEGTLAGKLMVQRCTACGTLQWEPEWLCHACHAFYPDWHEVAPAGTLFSWERVWHPVIPALALAVPYLVVVIALDTGGLRMVGNLLGNPLRQPSLGEPVVGGFERHEDPEPFALVQWERPDSG